MNVPDTENGWLQRFFTAPNALRWGALEDTMIDPLLRDELVAWLSVLGQHGDDLPVLLPRLTDQRTRWYVCSANPQIIAQVREEVEALVAHAYALVEAYPRLDAADPCEAALLERFGTGVCTIDVESGCHSVVLRKFEVYRQLVLRRPQRSAVGARPVGRVRLDFDKALLAGCFDEARSYIDEMRGSGRLSLQNQRFLEIRLLAAQGRWQVVVGNPAYLRSVIDLPLPRRIAGDLIESLYQCHLQQYELSDDPSGAIEAFRQEIRPRYARLFRARNGLKTPTALTSFLLNELCTDAVDAAHCSRLMDEYPPAAPGYPFAKRIAEMAWQEPVVLKDAAVRAREAYEDDRQEVALELYCTCDPDPEILKQVLRCLAWAKAPEDCDRAWRYCRSCPEEWLEALPARLKETYLALQDRFVSPRISDWCDWAEFILNGGDRVQAELIAQQEADQWSLRDFVSSEEKIHKFCTLLDKGMSSAPDFFQSQFPVVYEFVSASPTPLPNLRPLYVELLQLLALSSSVSESDLVLAQELVRNLLVVGTSPEVYQDVIDAVNELWDKSNSLQYLDWALDLAEMLAINPRPKPELGLRMFLKILQFVQSNRHRVDDASWLTLDMLGLDFEATSYVEQIRPAAEVVQVGTSPELQGKKVGIYSLTEQAALRAKRSLEVLYPGVIVEVNHDHESTQALMNLAKSADIFVFAWRSSKHQAYYCVKECVQKHRFLQPSGKGSTTIVRSVSEHVRKNA
ncbi:hypothetical protein M1B72_02660 [Geomonas paludis]|uniref:Uncharacterized protein n=1 Tax=Geomonas paludis TaxID=2740185 RepID=A0ABY4LI59_9BACT|nr:protein DpdD [Geomonas paludis]UPU36625.1 hypothetical protein M1B72_02660 [Geomonas paludis]